MKKKVEAWKVEEGKRRTFGGERGGEGKRGKEEGREEATQRLE